MVRKAKDKLDGQPGNIRIIESDLTDFNFDHDADLIVMNYTLQFISPEKRQDLLQKIYDALKPGATFVLSEKINTEKTEFFGLITDLYYDFKKRNGYSELEISRKREALENVMRPITPAAQLSALNEAGFKKSEMIFRWYNFASYLCVK
mgnify:CR=1 FL=1